MRADQPVGRGAANEIAARDQPEIARGRRCRARERRPSTGLPCGAVRVGGGPSRRHRAQAQIVAAGRASSRRRAAQRPPPMRPAPATSPASRKGHEPAMVGRNTSCPAALAAVRMPITRPCRARNQRAAIIGREIGADKAAAEPDHHAPQQHELPSLVHRGVNATADAVAASDRSSCGARRTGPSAPRRTGRSRHKAAG